MADEFALQMRLYRQIRRERPAFSQGIKRLCATVGTRKEWAHLRSMDWDRQRRAFTEWLDALLVRHPMPAGTAALWFEVPSELNEAFTSVSAYPDCDLSAPDFALEGTERSWPVRKNGNTLPAGLLVLDVLEEAIRESGFRNNEDGTERGSLSSGVFAVSHAIVSLLVLDAVPAFARRAGDSCREELGIAVGWADGDVDPLGVWTRDGWIDQPRRARVVPKLGTGELDPEDTWFDPVAFVKAGGNPNHRKKNGDPIICDWRLTERQVLDLLDLGANPKSRNAFGITLLMRSDLNRPDLLKRLVEAGVPLNARTKDGRTAIDCRAAGGSSTGAALSFLWKAGCRPARRVAPPFLPLHAEAQCNIFERGAAARIEGVLTFWVRNGCDVNGLDDDGRTPLWCALERHAVELTELLESEPASRSARMRQRARGHVWDHQHDRVARMLLSLGADANARASRTIDPRIPAGGTPLMVRRYDDATLVQELLRRGADPNAKSDEGLTALDYARKDRRWRSRPGHGAVDRVYEVLERAMSAKRR